MTSDRESELLRHIPTLASVAEAHGFRDALRQQGEQLTTGVYAALIARIDVLHRREARG